MLPIVRNTKYSPAAGAGEFMGREGSTHSHDHHQSEQRQSVSHLTKSRSLVHCHALIFSQCVRSFVRSFVRSIVHCHRHCPSSVVVVSLLSFVRCRRSLSWWWLCCCCVLSACRGVARSGSHGDTECHCYCRHPANSVGVPSSLASIASLVDLVRSSTQRYAR